MIHVAVCTCGNCMALSVRIHADCQAEVNILWANDFEHMRPREPVADGATHLSEHQCDAACAQLNGHIGDHIHGRDVQVATGSQVDQHCPWLGLSGANFSNHGLCYAGIEKVQWSVR